MAYEPSTENTGPGSIEGKPDIDYYNELDF